MLETGQPLDTEFLRQLLATACLELGAFKRISKSLKSDSFCYSWKPWSLKAELQVGYRGQALKCESACLPRPFSSPLRAQVQSASFPLDVLMSTAIRSAISQLFGPSRGLPTS